MLEVTYLARIRSVKFRNEMDAILRKFKKEAIATLGENLVCLLHHGSRAKGEAHLESDYDVVIAVKTINETTFNSILNIVKPYPRLSIYLLSAQELETLPRAHLLQLVHAKPLYGKINVKKPTQDEVKQFMSHIRHDELDMVRHYLLHPHPMEKKVKYVYYGLKSAYLYLSYLVFSESGQLPKTRKQTIAHFKKAKTCKEGVRLLQILDKWSVHKAKVAENPHPYMLLLEKFFRNAVP